MRVGINRALENQALYENTNTNSKCIFISHKSEDIEGAEAIGDVIKQYGIDIYLDINDIGLQYATENDDSEQIVQHIEKALSVSTHILVYITENTKDSWWVPYEIGYSKKGNIKIASLLNKHIENFPDYLKIEKTLKSVKDFNEYLNDIQDESSSELRLSFMPENTNVYGRKLSKYIRRE